MTGNLCEVAASQAKATHSAGITTADERSRQPWLPCAFVEIIHYQLKKQKKLKLATTLTSCCLTDLLHFLKVR